MYIELALFVEQNYSSEADRGSRSFSPSLYLGQRVVFVDITTRKTLNIVRERNMFKEVISFGLADHG
jgi:hypothetical protein